MWNGLIGLKRNPIKRKAQKKEEDCLILNSKATEERKTTHRRAI
jgi:hypothetical protein